MGAMSKWKSSAIGKARQLADLKGSGHVKAAGNAGIIVAAAGAAGVLDAKVGEVAGVKPSIAAGLVTATAGLITKSPRLVYGAAGMLAPAAYEASYDWASSMGAPNEVDPEGVGE